MATYKGFDVRNAVNFVNNVAPDANLKDARKTFNEMNLVERVCTSFINNENGLHDKVDGDFKKMFKKKYDKIKTICLRQIRRLVFVDSIDIDTDPLYKFIFDKYNLKPIESYEEYFHLIRTYSSDFQVMENTYRNC